MEPAVENSLRKHLTLLSFKKICGRRSCLLVATSSQSLSFLQALADKSVRPLSPCVGMEFSWSRHGCSPSSFSSSHWSESLSWSFPRTPNANAELPFGTAFFLSLFPWSPRGKCSTSPLLNISQPRIYGQSSEPLAPRAAADVLRKFCAPRRVFGSMLVRCRLARSVDPSWRAWCVPGSVTAVGGIQPGSDWDQRMCRCQLSRDWSSGQGRQQSAAAAAKSATAAAQKRADHKHQSLQG